MLSRKDTIPRGCKPVTGLLVWRGSGGSSVPVKSELRSEGQPGANQGPQVGGTRVKVPMFGRSKVSWEN